MITDGFHLDFTIKISTSQNSDFAFDFIRVSKLYCSTWLTEGDSSFKVCVTRGVCDTWCVWHVLNSLCQSVLLSHVDVSGQSPAVIQTV